VDSTLAFSIDGSGASNITTDTGDLTLETTTSGNVDVNSAGNVTIDGAVISIDGTSASNVSTTSANLTLSTITGGQLILTSAGDMDINVPAASTTAANIGDGSNTYWQVDSTAATPTLDLPQFNNLAGVGAGIELTTDDALVEGNVVHMKARSSRATWCT
jgi:hypothetical protein